MAAIAKQYIVRGRVQGVGFRYFVQKTANELGLRGYVRNLDSGDVEVYAIGDVHKLSDLNGKLRQGPPFSDVRDVDVKEAEVRKLSSFEIER